MVLEGYVTPDGVWAEYEAHDYDQAAADALNVYETQFLPRYNRKTQVAPSIGSNTLSYLGSSPGPCAAYPRSATAREASPPNYRRRPCQ